MLNERFAIGQARSALPTFVRVTAGAADGWRDSRPPCELLAFAGYIDAENSETSSLYISTEMDHAYRITKAARILTNARFRRGEAHDGHPE
jgi:hypothetical protein